MRRTVDYRFMDLFFETARQRDNAYREADERILAILAGEETMLFGRPVKFTVTWPEGWPTYLGSTEEEFRASMAEQLALIRRQ